MTTCCTFVKCSGNKVIIINQNIFFSVADLLVLIKGRQLIALDKASFTSWDIKTGVQSTTWSLTDAGSVFFKKDLIFVVNSKQDNLSLLTVS